MASVSSLPQRSGDRAARSFRALLARPDPRLRVPLCALAGLAAWLGPWPLALLLLCPALMTALAARVLVPGAGKLLAAFFFFALFWGLSFALMRLWEQGLGPDGLRAAAQGGLLFGLRLIALLGLALWIPLTTTPLTLGRVLTWYLGGPAWVERRLLGSRHLSHAAWRSGLALALMAAFLPRCLRGLAALRRSLHLRAPHLPAHRKLALLALAGIRLMGSQTWDITLALASRNLYSPTPWKWRAGK